MGLRLLIAAGEAASGPEELPPSVRSLIEAADDHTGCRADPARPLGVVVVGNGQA
jgi:hypothetical protein